MEVATNMTTHSFDIDICALTITTIITITTKITLFCFKLAELVHTQDWKLFLNNLKESLTGQSYVKINNKSSFEFLRLN